MPNKILEDKIDIEEFYNIISNLNLPDDETITVFRFIDKMADSKAFADLASSELRSIKASLLTDADLFMKISYGSPILISMGMVEFELKKNKINWDVWYKGEVILSDLGDRIITNIARDCNVIAAIHNSRLAKSQVAPSSTN